MLKVWNIQLEQTTEFTLTTISKTYWLKKIAVIGMYFGNGMAWKVWQQQYCFLYLIHKIPMTIIC